VESVTDVAGTFDVDVCVIGGAGHVGFPLAVAFASRGLRTCIFDIDKDAVDRIESGRAPFLEPGVQEPLDRALADGTLLATTDPGSVSRSEHVIVVVGTPVDSHLSPDPEAVPRVLGELLPHLRPGQLVVLRSTVFPGVTRRVERLLEVSDAQVDLAFCPERIAEGRAMVELFSLPQIVSARNEHAMKRAAQLFANLTESVIELAPEEAELAKLFTNSWRYIKFAAANSYYMIAADLGLDFARIRDAMMEDYPRASDLPGAGFAAGPCLFKDTMQLASVTGGTFALGHSAMLVNEGLPDYVVRRIEQDRDLSDCTVGILGMAFKAESDDRRSSLSYRLKRVLSFRASRVLTTDPYVNDDPDLVPLETVLAEADLLVVGAPHELYRELDTDLPVVDVWNVVDRAGPA
jgi:UDP-N-acetyl-D-mannosaminuronic acid dehydrogenase